MTREDFIKKYGYEYPSLDAGVLNFLAGYDDLMKSDLYELLRQEAKNVFRYVHRFGSLSEYQLEELCKQYKDSQNNKP